jgi:hypothetical protein
MSFSEAIDRIDYSLVEIEHTYIFWPSGEEATFPEVQCGKSNAVAVANKDCFAFAELLRDKPGLTDHILLLHEDLIEFTEGFRAIANNLREHLQRLVKIGTPPPFHLFGLTSVISPWKLFWNKRSIGKRAPGSRAAPAWGSKGYIPELAAFQRCLRTVTEQRFEARVSGSAVPRSRGRGRLGHRSG